MICSRFSNDRAPAFSVRTEIRETEEGREVVKIPCRPEAARHVSGLFEKAAGLSEAFRGSVFSVCPVTVRDGCAFFPYLEGSTLSSVLDGLLRSDREAFYALWESYFSKIDDLAAVPCGEPDAFAAVFGETPLPGETGMAPSDIDLIPENLIVRDGTWSVIDYEWTFPFPVPSSFVKWRALRYYLAGSSRRVFLEDGALYGRFGITEEARQRFERMERAFQAYTAGETTPLWKLYPEISPGVLPVTDVLTAIRAEKTQELKVYFDRGNGLSEEDTARFMPDGSGAVTAEFDAADARMVRLDPTERPCIVHVLKDEAGLLAGRGMKTNGIRLGDGRILFPFDDPQITLKRLPKDGKCKVTLSIERDREAVRSALSAAAAEEGASGILSRIRRGGR